ncbi:methionine aminopeptidase 1D, mitochondrial isoform X2 [Apis cerana]|uniref:Methionine aminopeptidase n=1 Tax=Apis cerana cerana TaxID=94128 RepID=A0A2A3EJC5_APICC|nr:methionine aminopeptidase 1D, mitochondrial isoform X2 [Apis cerana]PBC31131.1 Methionine aminopeptidase 1D [Apis cerana cerana]
MFLRSFFKKKSKTIPRKFINNSFGSYEVIVPWEISEVREVPSYIPKPSYSQTLIPRDGPKKPEIKDKNQIQSMKDSCNFAKKILTYIKQYIKPGITTDELDAIVHEMIISNGAYPSPLNYKGFPKSICTSINNVACHGIPDKRPLVKGDILNIDVTVYLHGYHGDCSKMFEVEECDDEAKRLINITELCLKNAIDICKPNENFSSIGNIIEETANKNGYSIIPVFAGHGIGTYFHGPPDIFHFANNFDGKMLPGMTFTIEPVLSQGSEEIKILEDGWTAVTVDNARTAQCEHTVLVTDTGCNVLTR